MPTWVPLAMLATLVALVARQAARPITDPDTFWHLRLGELVLANRSVAQPDWQTQDDRSFVLTQWLPEVIMAWSEGRFGLPAIAWLFGLVLVSLVVVVYRTCRQQVGELAAAFTTAWCLVGMSASLSPRPHMVTYLLLAVTVGAWLRTAADDRVRWWLIPLTWLWACSHGMWFTGVIVGFAMVCGMALDGSRSPRLLGRLLLLPLLSVAAATFTPVGPQLLTAPFAVGEVGAFITEWQPPSFRTIGPTATMGMIAVVVIAWSRAGRRIPWTSILLIAMAAGWTLLAARTVAIGAIIAAPLAAAALQQSLRRDPEAGWTKSERWFVPTTALLSLTVLALAVPHVADEPAAVPSALTAELDGLPAGAPVLNDYAVGGWLRWQHPTLDPLIDGLTEAYSVDELRAYARMTSVAAGWDTVLATSGADTALLPEGSPLATALEERLDWKVAGSDAGYVLLTGPGQMPSS